MIISCPKCSAGFFVSPQQIGEAGRRVKCSKCKNVWHATIDKNKMPSDEVVAKRVKDQKYVSGSNLPAIIPVKIPDYLYALPAIFSILIILTLYIFYPSINIKFGLCGPLCVPEGIRIEDIIHDYNRLNKKVVVEYTIANRSEYTQTVPFVQLKLMDENQNTIRTVYADGRGLKLEPNKVVKAKSEFNSVNSSSRFVKISLGSRFKFWVR